MFSSFEKEYKKTLDEVKFNKFYIVSSVIVSFVTYILSKIFPSLYNAKFICIFSISLLVISVFLYTLIDYIKFYDVSQIDKKDKLIIKISRYMEFKKSQPIYDLLILLNKYNFNTKNKLRIAIEHYSGRQSIKIESSIMAFVISTLISLASLISIFYDDQTKTFSVEKATAIINTTIGFCIIPILIAIIIFIIAKCLIYSNKKLYSTLNEEIAYIYVNYDKYKKTLNQ